MKKFVMLMVLVLLVLASAVGLRNLTASQSRTTVASTSMPVPVMPDTVASTSMPVPVMPDNLR
jgi:hypothetical protein